MTLVEVLAAVFGVALIVVVLLPMLARPRVTVCRINCVSNLKQIGLAFRMWSNDHEDKFPMACSTKEDGTLKFANTREVFRHFQAISNELNTPKVLACSADTNRTRTSDWSTFSNSNLSHFVGLDADEIQPQMFLSGDRNITTNGQVTSGILTLTSNSPVGWAKAIHLHYGNVGLADGSAQQVNNADLPVLFQQNTNWPVRLTIP
jgi:hypothetical protein